MANVTEQLNKEYADFINRKWVGPREYSCYCIVRDFYREFLGYNMRTPENWDQLKTYTFTDTSILLEGGEYTYRKEWGDELDLSQLQKESYAV